MRWKRRTAEVSPSPAEDSGGSRPIPHPQGFTIAAVATPPAIGGVGILRISGRDALDVAASLAPSGPKAPTPRYAYFVDLADRQGLVLDQGLFLYFRAPHSYTGEDVVELQVHGSPRLLQLLQRELLKDERVRTAEPGEFTRRAFLNGRVDLSRAEAVADLVSADSEAAIRAAARQLRGGLSEKVKEIREPLLKLRAELEGLLDFPAETEDEAVDVLPRVQGSLARITSLLKEAEVGVRLRRGARVVLIGPVNAGKSTLFNRLLGEERALVDAEPGTTRDVIEGKLALRGLTISLLDTAGLHDAPGRVEALGIQRARAALRSADLALLLFSPDSTDAEASEWLKEAAEVPVLRLWGKSDLACRAASPTLKDAERPAGGEPNRRAHCEQVDGAPLPVSGLTGAGVEELKERIWASLWSEGSPLAIEVTSERHADALRRAAEALERACEAQAVSTLEVVSGELGLAAEALGEITGESASEELLDAIFRRFCIGK